MARVDVKPELLEWAVKRSGKPREQLFDKYEKLDTWIKGETKPTLRQLEKFAKDTHTPLGFLFLQTPPAIELPIPHFRTISGPEPQKASADLIETVHTMQKRQSWLSEYLKEQGAEKLDYVGAYSDQTPPAQVAKAIRQALKLEKDWASSQPNWEKAFRALTLAAEHAGILVVANGIVGNNTRRKLNVEEFRGFVLLDDYAPLVFINNSDAKTAQMFTLAHEIADVFLGAEGIFNLEQLLPADAGLEKVCDQIAAEFLVPEEHLREIWSSELDSTKQIDALSKSLRVSRIVIARRALDLQLIGRREFSDYYQQTLSSAKGKGGGDFYASQTLRIGRRFGLAVVQAVARGDVLFSEAYRLTGLRGDTFDAFVKRLEDSKGGAA